MAKRLNWAVLLAGALWAMPRPSDALVLPSCPGASVATLPTGAWIPLEAEFEGLTAMVGGRPVPGEQILVEGYPYWRPDEPVPSGTQLDFSYEGCGGGSWVDSFSVRVEGRLVPQQIDMKLGLLLVLDENIPTLQVSCGVDEEALREAGFCDCTDCDCGPLPAPGAVTLELAETWRGTLEWIDPRNAAQMAQVLVRPVEWFGEESPDASWYRLDRWRLPHDEVNVADEQLCTRLELLNVSNEQRMELSRCVAPPAFELESQPVLPRFPASISSCTVPPEGFEEGWCHQYQRICEAYSSSNPTHVVCRHHYERCGTQPRPPRFDDIPMASGGTFGAGADEGGSGVATGGSSLGGNAGACPSETRRVQSCAWGLASGGSGGLMAVFVMVLGWARKWRRARRGIPCGAPSRLGPRPWCVDR